MPGAFATSEKLCNIKCPSRKTHPICCKNYQEDAAICGDTQNIIIGAKMSIVQVPQEFDKLAIDIREICKGETPAYFPNPGNWGDSLIRAGTIQFFLHYQLPFRTIYKNQYVWKKRWHLFRPKHNTKILDQVARQHRVAIFGGGGAWSQDHSSTGRTIASKISNRFEHIIVLPTSYHHARLDGEATYFTRDRSKSSEFVNDAQFCHDMALLLRPLQHEPTNDLGLFLRTDNESNFKLLKIDGNFDLSRMGDEMSDPVQFFLEVGKFRSIVTDRLHVAIAAGLLSRETFLLPGAYWKNASIYRDSLSTLCPSVRFVKQIDLLPKHVRSHLNFGMAN